MIRAEEIEWKRCRAAEPVIGEVRAALGQDAFRGWEQSLKSFLCDYFSAVPACNGKLGKSISPVKSGVRNGKGLKVRFPYPGCGKSGGLRLAVLCFCDVPQVKVAGAWKRSDNPDDDSFDEAFSHHDR